MVSIYLMPDSAAARTDLLAELQNYRNDMADVLRTSLTFVDRNLSLWGLDDNFDAAARMRNDKDGFETMRAIVGSLAAKARLHVIACLRANNINNLHSLAVQMRPMLECAGQIRVYMEGILSKRIEAIAGPSHKCRWISTPIADGVLDRL